MLDEFDKKGFLVIPNLFDEEELNKLAPVIDKFHKAWIEDNKGFYNSTAINSAYLTSKEYLNNDQRLQLFNLISCNKIIDIVNEFIPGKPCFMNTQLFFDPVNKHQSNYWHRDIQYLNISEYQQRDLLSKKNMNVVHFRIPLRKENGLGLVPGTHKRWDSDVEYEVRKELNGRKCFDDMPTGEEISLNKGDMLVFSANMIHRGLYGMNRLSLDLLFCDNNPDLLKYAKADCYPDQKDIDALKNSYVFSNALKLMQ